MEDHVAGVADRLGIAGVGGDGGGGGGGGDDDGGVGAAEADGTLHGHATHPMAVPVVDLDGPQPSSRCSASLGHAHAGRTPLSNGANSLEKWVYADLSEETPLQCTADHIYARSSIS